VGAEPLFGHSNYFRRIIAKSTFAWQRSEIRNAAVAISRCAFGSQSNKTHRRKSFAEVDKDCFPQKSLVRPLKTWLTLIEWRHPTSNPKYLQIHFFSKVSGISLPVPCPFSWIAGVVGFK
jgi:hypothetical protein